MMEYRIDVLEELKKVGYSANRMRREKILSESTMQRIREGSTRITVESLSVICSILHCQPSDVLEWVDDDTPTL